MAKRKRTLGDLLGDLAEAVDFPRGFSDSPATYVTKTRAARYLSESVHAFAQKHQAFGLLAKTANIAVVVGTTEYALPDDFCALLDLDSDPHGMHGSYQILGEQIILSTPRRAYTLIMRYVHELPIFDSGDAATSDFDPADDDGYILCKGAIDQWVVLDSAIKITRKQDKDPSALMLEREAIEQNLIQNLIDRDAQSPSYVRNDWDGAHSGHDPRGPGCD